MRKHTHTNTHYGKYRGVKNSKILNSKNCNIYGLKKLFDPRIYNSPTTIFENTFNCVKFSIKKNNNLLFVILVSASILSYKGNRLKIFMNPKFYRAFYSFYLSSVKAFFVYLY